MDSTTDIRTWSDLVEYLKDLSEEQLRQPAQFYLNDNSGEEVDALLAPVSIATVQIMFQPGLTRSWDDNQHHPEYHVLILDHNPFSPEGDTCYRMLEDGSMIGNKSGKVVESPFQDVMPEIRKRAEKSNET